MTALNLNKLVGYACISETFQAGLMNGRRGELIRLAEFALEPDEARALMAIKAETFADFAAAVEGLMEAPESRPARAEGAYRAAVLWPGAARTGIFYRNQH